MPRTSAVTGTRNSKDAHDLLWSTPSGSWWRSWSRPPRQMISRDASSCCSALMPRGQAPTQDRGRCRRARAVAVRQGAQPQMDAPGCSRSDQAHR